MVFSYFGGKNLQSKFIYDYINKNETSIYCEVFSGAFQVYFNKDFSFVNKVVYNDLNQYITNFFKCCQNPKFIDFLEYMTKPGQLCYFDQSGSSKDNYDKNYEHYKSLFYTIRQELMTEKIGKKVEIIMPDYNLGFKYGFLIRQSFSGLSNEKAGYSYSSSSYNEGKKQPEPKYNMMIRKLRDPNIIQKINDITDFEVLDFEDVIKKYDSKETLFYVDPPYKQTEGKYYRGDEHFGKSGHERLAKVLHKIKGKFILSYYDFPQLQLFYPKNIFKWDQKSFTKASTTIANKTMEEKQGHEILIMNF